MSDSPSSIDLGTFMVAIGALVTSTITFVLTYTRNRKSEQIKIARELMDRILTNYDRLIQYYTNTNLKKKILT